MKRLILCSLSFAQTLFAINYNCSFRVRNQGSIGGDPLAGQDFVYNDSSVSAKSKYLSIYMGPGKDGGIDFVAINQFGGGYSTTNYFNPPKIFYSQTFSDPSTQKKYWAYLDLRVGSHRLLN